MEHGCTLSGVTISGPVGWVRVLQRSRTERREGELGGRQASQETCEEFAHGGNSLVGRGGLGIWPSSEQ